MKLLSLFTLRVLGHVVSMRIAAAIGLMTVTIGSFFLVGYLFGHPSFYTWPENQTPVSLPAVLLFMALGLAVYLLALFRELTLERQIESEDSRLDKIEKLIKDLPCVTGQEEELLPKKKLTK